MKIEGVGWLFFTSLAMAAIFGVFILITIDMNYSEMQEADAALVNCKYLIPKGDRCVFKAVQEAE